MNDAEDRDKERAARVKLYKEEDAKAAQEVDVAKGAGFIKAQLNKAVEDSLEKSIKQKVFKSQRSRAMDNNFARK